MTPQDQNQEKAPYQSQPANPSAIQKNELPKEPVAGNAQSGAQDKTRKDTDTVKTDGKDVSDYSTSKGSCGTK